MGGLNENRTLCGFEPTNGTSLRIFLDEWRAEVASGESRNIGRVNTDDGIKEWSKRGFPTDKLVLGLPYYDNAWILVNSGDIDSKSLGSDVTVDGSMGKIGLTWINFDDMEAIKAKVPYAKVKGLLGYTAFQLSNDDNWVLSQLQLRWILWSLCYGIGAVYNSTYVVNYLKIGWDIWINFDDVEAIKAKVSYAKVKGLLGYNAFQLSNDDNWVLSQAAYGIGTTQPKKHQLLVIVLATVAAMVLLIMALIYYLQHKVFKSQGLLGALKMSVSLIRTKISGERKHENGDPNLQALTFATIKAATNNFSNENKLGEGGYGPVYKGELSNGQEVAVKRLSRSSNQGLEEFNNEINLTAKLQHVNLVRVLGICTQNEEKMLVYEFMLNKSLDFYLYDPFKRHMLDWRKRISIIEGVTQGLLYLQEYSNYTIIHRDIKASNILLDSEMNPKISDFGMANGYVPPEYVKKGIYSTKYDVYSFGVLLLQIISGKRNSSLTNIGKCIMLNDNIQAYELWKQGRGAEFFDASLDDSSSSCKLMTCMQLALLCVQENPADRPSMVEVFTILKNKSSVAISVPKQPAYSTTRDERKDIGRKKVFSVNDASITQVKPR
ncbi:hypothetical protein CXB51_036831 [Gossypium anomalum]|uniref:non-specific serine/threonine protein kinase n=1 Tax=Gossypium anomalum TaxID=47600 RepID=A0A8J6CL81_9ROSI|nr:hypothetical protein CXB51_036831 [Gossypium anomalum]